MLDFCEKCAILQKNPTAFNTFRYKEMDLL